MRGSPVKLIVSLFLAILMVAFPLAWTAGGGLPTETRFIAYVSIFCAFAYLLKSGANELTPATWFVIMAAYPILTPLITIDLLGYPYYASGLRQYQTLESMTVPVVLGGLGTLFIALNVSKKKLACPRGLTQHLGETTWAGRTAMILFVLACLALLAANFLDAPPSLLGLGKTHYRDIKETRDDSLNFASSLVMVFAATALLSLIVLKVNARATRRTRYIAGGVFLGICMFIVMWQILSASRIEAIGILLILMFTFGNRAPRSIRRAAMIGVFLIFAGVGYLRTVLTLQDYLSRNYVSWPGGPENVFKTYSFGLNAIRDGDVPLQYGQTYIDLLARLPPSFFGIQRPPRAYDLLAEKAPLIGGEYFLTEPYLNFMGIGVAVALVLLVWMLNASIRSLSAFYFQPDRVFSGILAATLLMFSFRLFWYGFEHTLKTMTAAVVVGLPLLLLVTAARASRRGRTKRRRVPAPMPAPSPAE